MSKYFKFSSNKSPMCYSVGEKMIFSICAMEDGKPVSCEYINWEMRGDDGKKQKGKGGCTAEKPLVLETNIERAGFVHIICNAVNEKGEAISDFDVLEAGAGADVEKIKYHDTIPEDFDLYWSDIEKQVENSLLNDDIDCDVLKVAHHGSSTSSSKKFIKAVSPEYAVISCGKDNDYGHPHTETILNLKDSRILRTDEIGTIVIKSDGYKINI